MIKSKSALIAMVAAVMGSAFTAQASFAQDKKTLAFVVKCPRGLLDDRPARH